MGEKIVEIIIEDKEKLHLKQFVDCLEDIDNTFIKLMSFRRTTNDDLWDELKKIYPEIFKYKKAKPSLAHPKDEQWKIIYFMPDNWEDSNEIIKLEEE